MIKFFCNFCEKEIKDPSILFEPFFNTHCCEHCYNLHFMIIEEENKSSEDSVKQLFKENSIH